MITFFHELPENCDLRQTTKVENSVIVPVDINGAKEAATRSLQSGEFKRAGQFQDALLASCVAALTTVHLMVLRIRKQHCNEKDDKNASSASLGSWDDVPVLNTDGKLKESIGTLAFVRLKLRTL